MRRWSTTLTLRISSRWSGSTHVLGGRRLPTVSVSSWGSGFAEVFDEPPLLLSKFGKPLPEARSALLEVESSSNRWPAEACRAGGSSEAHEQESRLGPPAPTEWRLLSLSRAPSYDDDGSSYQAMPRTRGFVLACRESASPRMRGHYISGSLDRRISQKNDRDFNMPQLYSIFTTGSNTDSHGLCAVAAPVRSSTTLSCPRPSGAARDHCHPAPGATVRAASPLAGGQRMTRALIDCPGNFASASAPRVQVHCCCGARRR